MSDLEWPIEEPEEPGPTHHFSHQVELEDRVEYHDHLGQPHRIDGPACEWANGAKRWYINGKLHRSDGPAVEYANGTKEWWICGEQVSEEDIP